jgi:hypothetical protein
MSTPPLAYYRFVRVLSVAFDFIFFSSLAFLVWGFAGNEFAFLPIIFALGGVIVQASFLRRFRSSRRPHALAETKICQACNRAISIDAKICRFCLTEVDESPASSAQVADSTEIQNLQLRNERWQAASNADL